MLIPSENTFARAVELWREWNSRINVISRKDEDNIFAHHILHSLAIARYLEIYYPSCGCIPPSGVRPSGSPHHPFGTVPPLSNRGCYVPQGECTLPRDVESEEQHASACSAKGGSELAQTESARPQVSPAVAANALNDSDLALCLPLENGGEGCGETADNQAHNCHASFLDVGTGGGFPGIPLAMVMPEARFTLCDSIGKKVRVAQAVADGLGLKNVECVNARVESLPGQWDWIVSRAVTSLENFYPWVKGRFRNSILYLKGGDIETEIAALQKKYHVPSENIRTWDINSWLNDEYFAEKFVIEVGKNYLCTP